MTTQATIPLILIPDQKERAVSLLPSQFRDDQPVIAALCSAMGEGVQTLEDLIFGLMLGSRLDAAGGALLDIWGDLVGEVRGDLSDNDYRRFVAGRVLANRSTGTPDHLIQIAQIITSDSVVREQAYYPHETIIYVFRSDAMSTAVAGRVAGMMSDSRAAGHKLQVIEYISGYLGFLDNPDQTSMPTGIMGRNIL